MGFMSAPARFSAVVAVGKTLLYCMCMQSLSSPFVLRISMCMKYAHYACNAIFKESAEIFYLLGFFVFVVGQSVAVHRLNVTIPIDISRDSEISVLTSRRLKIVWVGPEIQRLRGRSGDVLRMQLIFYSHAFLQ